MLLYYFTGLRIKTYTEQLGRASFRTDKCFKKIGLWRGREGASQGFRLDYNWQGNLGAPLWNFLEPVNTIRNKTADVFTDLEMNKLPWLIRVTWCHKALKIKSRVQREGSVGKIACHQPQWPKFNYGYLHKHKGNFNFKIFIYHRWFVCKSSTCMLSTFEDKDWS